LGDLEATYGDHLRLVGKRVGDFLLVKIELFSLGRTAEALRAIIGSKSAITLQRGPVDPKFQIEGVAPTYHSSSRKTRLDDLSHGYKNLDRFFFRFVAMHAFVRQTDKRTYRQTEMSSLDRVCVPCSAVEITQTSDQSFLKFYTGLQKSTILT